MKQRLFVRRGYEPLITPDDLAFRANAVLNPGAAVVNDQVLLLLRIEDRRGISHIRVARSHNGIDDWRIDGHPLLEPDLSEHPLEEWGCEDPRVTEIEPGKWVIAYTAYSRYGPAVALARTEDFTTVERIGIAMSPENKDAAVLPGSFEGMRIMLHRPVTGGQEHIWYACSPVGTSQWGSPGVLLPERAGPWWDGLRVGVGAPPILTDEGWLLIYHGVKEMGGGPVYRLGVALLDLDNPRKVIARSSEWVFGPEAEYEQKGLVPNVVYTCGAILRGGEVWMYYGAADTSVALATADLKDLLSFVHETDFLRHVGRQKGMVE
jgi:beta-1,4-mannooligosaccharide/beta-1,4-mannosyl-N-acetylglucosamine phosphorylase